MKIQTLSKMARESKKDLLIVLNVGLVTRI